MDGVGGSLIILVAIWLQWLMMQTVGQNCRGGVSCGAES